MAVSYRLSIVTIALSLAIFYRNLPSNISDAQINKGWLTFGNKTKLQSVFRNQKSRNSTVILYANENPATYVYKKLPERDEPCGISTMMRGFGGPCIHTSIDLLFSR